MEQVLNAKERNIAFWKFLGFFLITILLVVGAVYFNYGVQAKETTNLRTLIKTSRQQTLAQENFLILMQDAANLIDSLAKPGVNREFISQMANRKLVDMTNQVKGDSSLYGKLNLTIVKIFSSYHDAQDKWVKAKADQDKYEKAQTELADKQKQLDQCIQEKAIFMRQ